MAIKSGFRIYFASPMLRCEGIGRMPLERCPKCMAMFEALPKLNEESRDGR